MHHSETLAKEKYPSWILHSKNDDVDILRYSAHSCERWIAQKSGLETFVRCLLKRKFSWKMILRIAVFIQVKSTRAVYSLITTGLLTFSTGSYSTTIQEKAFVVICGLGFLTKQSTVENMDQ